MNLTYTSTDPNAAGGVDVDVDVKRALRFRAGASVSLGFLRLFGGGTDVMRAVDVRARDDRIRERRGGG